MRSGRKTEATRRRLWMEHSSRAMSSTAVALHAHVDKSRPCPILSVRHIQAHTRNRALTQRSAGSGEQE